MIDSRIIERVLAATNIVDVIGDFYELKKAGQTEWMCLCPFHQDRHMGSFKVSSRKNIYTCFSCGATGDAVEFLEKHEGLSFPDAIRWLGAKYGIAVEGSERYRVRRCEPHQPQAPLPVLELPLKYVLARRNYTGNVWVAWLKSQAWDMAQRGRIEGMLRNYNVGTAKDGRTIWWQMDEEGRLRTGKLMRYQENGHRDKSVNPTWVHTMLAQAGKLDLRSVDVKQCLFGLHLTDLCPQATVNIVESEKTAVTMAVAYGDLRSAVWMATGGKESLRPSKLQPLIDRGRHIVLYPDRDAVDEWKELAEGMGYDRLSVNDEPVRIWWKSCDGEKADIADVIVRWLGDPIKNVKTVGEVTEDIVKELAERNEGMKILVDELKLEKV